MAEEKAQKKAKAEVAEVPDTPSALALEEVGNLDGEDVKPNEVEKAAEHGEKYQAAKKKHKWG
jgi:hypothetical protein